MAQTHEENLHRTAAVDKIREIAKSTRVGFLGTCEHGSPVRFDPMALQDVDALGVVWFLSARSSEKNRRIARDSRVHLLISNPADSEYLSLTGSASISDSLALREQCWSPLAKMWFPGGVNDPELTVIAMHIEDGHYWDTPHGKAFPWLMIAVEAVTGRTADAGVEGRVTP
jgi:general stress protein 26